MCVLSGLDLRLIKSLGLPQFTKHMFVSYMGCHAGLIGLRTAAEIACADPKNRVLVISSEVNSVNAQAPDPAHPVNNIIVDIIFGDGGAGHSNPHPYLTSSQATNFQHFHSHLLIFFAMVN